ncbi:MAG TPA: hypothetical protein VIF62_22025 [Labilithrix sp.]|jgi:hypothetical protein
MKRALLVLFLVTVSSSAAAQDASGVEQTGAEKRYLPNRPLLVAGAATFVGAYATGVVVAAESKLDADKRLYVPVVGMWLDVANRPCATCTTGDTFATISFVAGGVAQVAGLALVATSFVFPEKKRPLPRAAVQIVPLQLAGGGGLGALGTF